jgi:hypothetical protein
VRRRNHILLYLKDIFRFLPYCQQGRYQHYFVTQEKIPIIQNSRQLNHRLIKKRETSDQYVTDIYQHQPIRTHCTRKVGRGRDRDALGLRSSQPFGKSNRTAADIVYYDGYLLQNDELIWFDWDGQNRLIRRINGEED